MRLALILCRHANRHRDKQRNRGNHQEPQEGTRPLSGTAIGNGRGFVSTDTEI